MTVADAVPQSPISAADFAIAMARLGLDPAAGRVAIAVSGGPDSMALAGLCAAWGKSVALIVDHGLRPASADEALRTRTRLEARGIDAEILYWRGDKPATGIQEAARAARYRLLEARCRALGVSALLLAHHQDDQAETLLLRLARGSGVRGLSGMAAIAGPVASPGYDLPRRYRPLLGFPKSRLVATCETRNFAYVCDPSNANPDFDRSKVRSLLAAPPLEGLNAARLTATAARLARSAAALDHYVAAHIERTVRLYPEGHAALNCGGFFDAPEDIVLSALSLLVQRQGGASYPPAMDSTEALCARVRDGRFRGATLAGCRLLARRNDSVLLCREHDPDLPPLPLEAGQMKPWDNRMHVMLESGAPVQVSPLGETGWRALVAGDPSSRIRSDLPHPVRLSLPAAWREGLLVAVPHLGYSAGDTAMKAALWTVGAPCGLSRECCDRSKAPLQSGPDRLSSGKV